MSIEEAIAAYLTHLKQLHRSYWTIRNARCSLARLAAFLQGAKIAGIEQISAAVLEDFRQELYFHLSRQGAPLCLRTQAQHLICVKGLTRFLRQADYLLSDPGEKLRLPKKPKRLPKRILTVAEIKRLLAACDLRTHIGFRDRIIVEILYDTAMRRGELAKVRIADLNLAEGHVRIAGKGGNDRAAPLSARLCELLRAYLHGVRPHLAGQEGHGHLIVTHSGGAMTFDGIYRALKRRARIAGLKKGVGCHTLRHSCATHMLKNGAPIRHLQELLGHASLESTQIYTQVTINDLKEIHARYHPSEQLKEKQG